MATLEIILLGGFQALAAGHAIDVPGRKERALLALLAMPPGEPRSRDKLAGMLWSDRADKQARDSLKQAVLRLRKSFGAEHPLPLLADRDTVTLDRRAVTVDVAEFERLVKAGKWEAAAALYRGPLLDGHGVHDGAFEDWILVERTRLHDLAIDVTERFAASQSSDAAIATAQRLLQLDPVREETHRLLMRLYAAAGQRAQALRQYEHCRDILQRDLQATPDAETERLHRQVQSETTPPLATPPTYAASGPAPALNDKPSIAVLPFHNLSGDPEQQYFSDGIAEDIITELSRFRDLFVIARNSSFQYQGTAIDIRRVGRELGVHCVVEGSVRTLGDRIRIAVQLIDASTGNHLWAERYDRDMQDIFAVQEGVARSVASTIGGRVAAAGRDRALRVSVSALKAYDLVLRAKALILRYNKVDNEQARLLAEKAVQLDPTTARAYTLLAWCHFYNYMAWWVADRGEALEKAYEAGQRAVMLDDTDSYTRMHLGLIHLYRRQYDEAQSEIEKAVDLNPNDSEARGAYGIFLTCAGKPGAAIEQFDLATRHNPFDLNWIPWCKGIAYFTAHRYEEAISTLKRVRDPINEVRGWLAASYAHAGRLTEARARLEEFLRVAERDMTSFPGRRIRDWEPYWHGAMEYRDERDFDHLFAALHKAGLSE